MTTSMIRMRVGAAGAVGVCLLVAVSLLAAATTAAFRLPGIGALGRLGSTSLDYSRAPHGAGYYPLTDRFVDETLRRISAGARPAADAPATAGADGASAMPAGGSRTDDGVPPPDLVGGELRNDGFNSAYAIRGLPFTTRSTAPASREPGEPTTCAATGGTRWFRFTPRSDLGVVATTSGSEPGAAVAVFSGSRLPNLVQEACDNDARGEALVTWPARRGTTYWLQVTKTVTSGALAFSIDVQGRTALASVSTDGRPASADSGQPHTSADGRFVAFVSMADLVPGTQNGCVTTHHPSPQDLFARAPGPCQNVYLRDITRGTTALVSTADGTVGGNDDSWNPSISGDGRFVAFVSWASDLVPGDTNGTIDVFVRDVVAGQTTRVNVTSEGSQTSDTGHYGFTAVSDDGRFVAFSTNAPELTAQSGGIFCEPPSCVASFIRDVHMGRTHLVSLDAEGDALGGESLIAGLSGDGRRVAFSTLFGQASAQAQVMVSEWQRPGRVVVGSQPNNPGTGEPNDQSICLTPTCLSSDGRYLVFLSWADNLVPGDNNDQYDFFVRDLVQGRTTMVSVSSAGVQANPPPPPFALSSTNASAGFPSAAISPDGRFVVFATDAPDLVPGDTNAAFDVFLHDVRRGTTTRASVRTDGSQSSGVSYRGAVSRDARSIAFVGRGFDEEDAGFFSVYIRQQPAY